MPSLALPWVIGPIPIMATIWSTYMTATALLRRREMTGERFIAAFLFPLGIIAAISLIFLPQHSLRIVLTAGQLATTLCFAAIYSAEKMRRGDPLLMWVKETTPWKAFWHLYFSLIIYIFYWVIIFIFPISEACATSKCYMLELLFGGKIYNFSVLYFLNFVGSTILAVIILILIRFISEVQARN